MESIDVRSFINLRLRGTHLGKNLLFYTVASTVIGVVLGWAGVSLMVPLFISLVGPPALLLLIAIAKYRGIL